MQYLSIITSLFPILLAMVQAQSPCKPGEISREDPPGSGIYECTKVEWHCGIGDDRKWVNAATNARGCCPVNQELVIYNQDTREGACCGEDQTYAGIAPNGKCCLKGQILSTDGKCISPPGGNCPSCPNQPTGACRLQLACGDSTKTNGLKYGSCYQIMFPNTDNAQLGREPDTATGPGRYISEGHLQNIVYRICQSTTDCGTGAVKPTDTFYIEDDVGPSGDATSKKGWLQNTAVGTPILLTTDPKAAAPFKGTTSCSACACVISLTGVGKGMGTFGDRHDQPEIAFFANPKVALDMQFAELPCDGAFSFPQN